MILPARRSVSLPSRPYPTSMRIFRSFFGNEEDDAIIQLPLPDLPFLRDLDGIFLENRALQGRDGEDNDLGRFFILEFE